MSTVNDPRPVIQRKPQIKAQGKRGLTASASWEVHYFAGQSYTGHEQEQANALRNSSEFTRFVQCIERAIEESVTARRVSGLIDHDENESGGFAIHVIAASGDKFAGTVRPVVDAQSGLLSVPVSADLPAQTLTLTSQVEQSGPSTADHWARVHDSSTTVESREEAIEALLDCDKARALKYVVEELDCGTADQDWLIALVFIAESVHFPPELRPTLQAALLRIAKSLHESSKAGVERAVWSAVRRTASLVLPEQSCVLLPFLSRVGVIDARAVALGALEHTFFLEPPADFDTVAPLADRAFELAKKFLDPDIFSGGENALLAMNAVCCLAALGDQRLSETVALAQRLNRRWLKHQLRTRFKELLSSWKDHGVCAATSKPFHNLQTVLNTLG